MLWLQIASHMGIALLAFVAQMQGHNTLYPTNTIGLLINAVLTHIPTITEIAHSLVATAPPRPAAQYPILDPTTMTSKDFTPWTPTMLPVSEERQPSCFITAPAPPPSTVAEMDNYTLVSQVDYLTMDPIVLEEHVELGEPMDMSQLTCLLWRGVLAVAIVCGIYIVTMEFMNSTMKKDIYASRWRSSIVVSPMFVSDTDAGAASLFHAELALNSEDASADFLSSMLDIISGLRVATGPDWNIYDNDSDYEVHLAQTAEMTHESEAANNLHITSEFNASPAFTADTAPAHFGGDDAVYNPDTLAIQDTQTADIKLKELCKAVENVVTVNNPPESTDDDASANADLTTTASTHQTGIQEQDAGPDGWHALEHVHLGQGSVQKKPSERALTTGDDAGPAEENVGEHEKLEHEPQAERKKHKKGTAELIQEQEVKIAQEQTATVDQIKKNGSCEENKVCENIEQLEKRRDCATLQQRNKQGSQDTQSRRRRKRRHSSANGDSACASARLFNVNDSHAQSSTFPSAQEHTPTATSGLTCASMSHAKPQIIYQTGPEVFSINYTRAPSSFEHFVFSDLPEGPLGYQTPVLPEVSCDYKRVYIPTPNPPRSLRATPSSAPSRVAPSVAVPSPSPTSPPSGEASGSAQGETTERRRPRNYGERAFQSAFAAALRPRSER
ncbi:hypothetical protein IEO21_08695 [Rhodonia placenta]|uniref:Transmembrane protein n=1 Tax=Rhodonia placenta TaxID=104341 RepID=A0A8H7NVQ0_9APHY|nr:hypothetical protein IEO21_08695 [Postia placenta]